MPIDVSDSVKSSDIIREGLKWRKKNYENIEQGERRVSSLVEASSISIYFRKGEYFRLNDAPSEHREQQFLSTCRGTRYLSKTCGSKFGDCSRFHAVQNEANGKIKVLKIIYLNPNVNLVLI